MMIGTEIFNNLLTQYGALYPLYPINFHGIPIISKELAEQMGRG